MSHHQTFATTGSSSGGGNTPHRAIAASLAKRLAARAADMERMPELWRLHGCIKGVVRATGWSKERVRAMARDLNLTPITPAIVTSALSETEQRRRERAAERRAETAKALPALLKEHGSIRAVCRALKCDRLWLNKVANEAGIDLSPKPAPAPEPEIDVEPEPEFRPINASDMPTVEHCSNSREARARALLRTRRRMDPEDLRSRTGLPLREAYRLIAEMRREKRA